MTPTRPRLVVGTFVGAFVLGSAGAYAQTQDGIKWRASLGVSNTDNIFNASTAPVSDTITSESLGVNLSLPSGLQRFELDASVVANQYQKTTNFDYTGTNFNASWLWSLTPQLRGTLGSIRTETLNSANDSVNPNLRNKLSTQTTVLTAAYDLGGPWQITGGAVNTNTVNERAVIGQPDNHSTGVNAGVRYALGSGNSVAYFHQVAQGNSSSNYVATTDDLSLVWVLSGNTTFNGHIANVQHRYDGASQYDFNGTSGGASLVWRLTGKTSITAGWQRDLASYQTNTASYTQTDSFSIAPVWQISPITSMRLQYRSGQLTDQGSPFGTNSGRQDQLQDTSISFNWQPYQLVSLSATLSESSRSSNVAGTDFRSRLLALLAVFSF